MGCRFPGGAHDPESFWQLLMKGSDAVVDVPKDRWDWRRYYDPDPARPGKLYIRQGGFLQQKIDEFDAEFFRFSPREAARLDPQQRILLEVAWEALEDAGIPLERIAGTNTGVFVGGFTMDSLVLQSSPLNRDEIGSHTATGVGFTMLAARLSYTFDLRGPSQTIDTACSSSLVATHLACMSLWSGDCSTALVGGVNLIFDPGFVVVMCKGGFLSPDARCKAFDASANGYARGEGAGVAVLKPLSAALANGDPIYATIRGTGVNQDGFSDGITVPSRPAQERLLRLAYERAGVSPSSVAYVEAHGTGTPVGDPIEASALGAVLGSGRPPERPCLIGSVKTNIGHLEAASGMAGLIKAALVLRHGEVPPHLHFATPNPAIDFNSLGLRVANVAQPLPGRGDGEEGEAFAGVNSFGYGGTNAHVVLAREPHAKSIARARERGSQPELVVLSARSAGALRDAASAWLQLPELSAGNAAEDVYELARAAAVSRTHHEHRVAIVAARRSELASSLESVARGERTPAAFVGRARRDRRPRVAFVFTGMGPQWWRMGRELLASEPVFRAEVEACDAAMRAHGGPSVIEELLRDEAQSQMALTLVAQTTNFALQAGLAALLRSWGISPDAVVGHSVGEVAAAYTAGALTLREATLVSVHRARLQATTAGRGGMMAVGLSVPEAESFLARHASGVSIAAINSTTAVTLAGDHAGLAEIARILAERQVFHRELRVEIAYHSAQMDCIEHELREALGSIRPQRPTLKLYSTVTGGTEGSWDAAYWWRNVRQPVLFANAVDAMLADGFDTFVEVGPHPVLSSALKEGISRSGRQATALTTLRREQPERQTLLACLGELYTLGLSPDWQRLFAEPAKRVRLPSYRWQRERHWVEAAASRSERIGDGEPVLPGTRVQGPQPAWERQVNAQFFPWLADHQVEAAVVFPGAGYILSAIAAARLALGESTLALEHIELRRALVIGADEVLLRTLIDEDAQRVSVHSRVRARDSQWRLHAAAHIIQRTHFPPLSVDARAIEQRCGEVLESQEIYARLDSRGLRYGEAFRKVTRISIGENECLAEIAAKGSESEEASTQPLSPPILDAALHALLAAQPASEERTVMVPVRIDRFVLHSDGTPPRMLVWGRVIARDERSVRADLMLFDPEGAPVAEVRGLHCERISGPAAARSEELDGLLYASHWEQEQPAEQEAGTRPAPDRAAGTWLLVSSGGEGARLLAGELEKHGARCVHAAPDDLASLRRSLGELRTASPPCAGLVFLATDAAQASTPAEQAMKHGTGALAAIQALAKVRWKDAPRLWLVTTSAQGPGGARVDPSHASIWGLGRVAANEHPQHRCTLVDLGGASGDAPREWAALARELLADGPETELALRGSVQHVHRERRLDPEAAGHREVSGDELPFSLEPSRRGDGSPVVWRERAHAGPGPGEIQVRVEATAVSLRDVADLHARRALGAECAGTVVAVGEGVHHMKAGDPVIAVAPGCHASTFMAPAQLVAHRQPGPAIEAASPLALAAAVRALELAPSLDRESTVLVHGADTTPGFSAVKLARLRGARILATADDEATARLLTELGAQVVGRARDGRWADALERLTEGRGVDLVINTIEGPLGKRGLLAVGEGGRFVDLAADGATPLEATKVQNLGIDRVDLPSMAKAQPKRLSALLSQVSRLLAEGSLRPPPARVFSFADAGRAYEQARQGLLPVVLQRSEHEKLSIAPPRHGPSLRADATYLVVGGLAGFGLTTAQWLVERGARSLVLASRRGEARGAEAERIESFRRNGVRVWVARADVTSRAELATLLERMDAELPPLRGVVHAATTYDDDFMLRLDSERLSAVMAPKVLGAWNLHELTAKRTLDLFLLYSSASAVLGFQGQASYAAANSFLDALADHRRGLGLPATSLNWGALDAGLVARDEGVARRLEQQGAIPLSMDQAFAVLDFALRARVSRCTPMGTDWRRWGRIYPQAAARPRFDAVAARDTKDSAATGASLREALAVAPAEQRLPLLTNALREIVARVFGISTEKLDPSVTLKDMALDSMMATELANLIERTAGVNLSLLRLLEGPSLHQLAEHVLELMGNESTGAAPSPTHESPA
ncbi:MAG: SDR family NAD(P)-dependent oxidoreductase [Myxococcaceae bacterium]|nr:SDR family NAD(P)-dependent oxidoreductase [Myxococcaceae bacterium]